MRFNDRTIPTVDTTAPTAEERELSAKLIETLDTSLRNGYIFTSLDGKIPLLTTRTIIEHLLAGNEINVIEPDGQYNEFLHKKQ